MPAVFTGYLKQIGSEKKNEKNLEKKKQEKSAGKKIPTERDPVIFAPGPRVQYVP